MGLDPKFIGRGCDAERGSLDEALAVSIERCDAQEMPLVAQDGVREKQASCLDGPASESKNHEA